MWAVSVKREELGSHLVLGRVLRFDKLSTSWRILIHDKVIVVCLPLNQIEVRGYGSTGYLTLVE